MNHFSETTSTSYMQNIGNSFKGILFGLLMFVGSIVLMFWNESRSASQASALAQMQENIQVMPSTKLDPNFEAQAVLIYGDVQPLSQVVDKKYGITPKNGLSLHRKAQMYMWKETKQSESKDEVGGSTTTTTTYDYSKVWTTQNIDSSSFKHREGHENPIQTITSKTYLSDAKIGDYSLSKSVVSNFANEEHLSLSFFPSVIGAAKNNGDELYIGQDAQNPQVGDVKISYTFTPAGNYTIAAAISGVNIVPYATDYDRSFVFVRHANVSAEQIFKEEFSSNATLTWILRVVGLVLMFISFTLILGPLGVIANVLPMFGSLVGMATGLISFVLTLLIGTTVIVLAWFSARPIVLIGSIIIIIAGFVYFSKKIGTRSAPVQNEENEALDSSATPPPRQTPPPRREE